MQKLYKMFTTCLPVKGASRSIICDLQRYDFDFIPNVLFDILQKEIFSLNSLIKEFGTEHKDTIKEYIDFLIEKEYCFEVKKSEIHRFPPLNTDWDSPYIISNSILELDKLDIHIIESIFNQLDELGGKFIELKFYETQTEQHIDKILSLLEGSIITSVNLYLKFDEKSFNLEEASKIIRKYYRVDNLYLHSANEFRRVNTNNSSNLYLLNDAIYSHISCGIISPLFFNVNISLFTESQKHNTCLNRKISIDVNGEIKNCPSMTKSYGNIKDTTLKEVLEKTGFKDVWNIHKDQVEVCKDCEFRHICTDCRAYIQDPNNIYSKPVKCSYDPYTATWGEENPTNNQLYGQ